jgi:hypothetical protein
MFNEKNLDSLFYEIIKNENLEENRSFHLDRTKLDELKKCLMMIDSLNHSSMNISSMLINIINDANFTVDKEISDIMENMYMESEKLRLSVAKFLTNTIIDFCDEKETNSDG